MGNGLKLKGKEEARNLESNQRKILCTHKNQY